MNYLLVHGSWHGNWCWYKVVAELKRRGRAVFAPNLPGCEGQQGGLPTLRDYVSAVGGVIGNLPDASVILVGHSMGGGVISAVAEAYPEKLQKLVYLSASLVPDGHSMMEVAQDDISETQRFMRISADGTFSTFAPEGLRSTFYADCSDEDVALAKLLVRAQPLEPFTARLNLTNERYGRIPRAYVMCTQDVAINIGLQRKMLKQMPCQQVVELNSSHSPFLSLPRQLVTLLEQLSA